MREAKDTSSPPCAHCGLPVGKYPVGNDPYFCCTGCAVVFDTLYAAGYGATFYQLRSLTDQACPVPQPATEKDQRQLAALDVEVFLDTHTQCLPDGTRQGTFALDGVHCAGCVWVVEQLPYEQDGVQEARLDLPRARVRLRWDPEHVALSEIAVWLNRFGYTLSPLQEKGTTPQTETEHRLLVRMGVAWALAGNVMLLAFAMYAGLTTETQPGLAHGVRWLSLVLTATTVGYGGMVFFVPAFQSLRQALKSRRIQGLHMDVPIALGIAVGFGHSAWATVMGQGDVWFDSVAVLIAALLTAKWLQLRSRRLAGAATDRLFHLLPSIAWKVDAEGRKAMVPVADLEIGDRVWVEAGDVLPVDGVVLEGTSRVEQAMLTGESKPVAVGEGATVLAGTTNVTHPLHVQVAAVGGHTRVGQMLDWIREGAFEPAPIVTMAGRLTGYFVGTVLVLALLTAVLWWMVNPAAVVPHVVALLVITCPCALGMATPLAMAIGTGRAAKQGLFIRNDGAFQQLPKVDAVVLDKTGTLTEGALRLVDFSGDEAAIRWAAALERGNTHPVGTALQTARPAAEQLDVAEVVHVTGAGVRGRVGDHEVQVGRPDWVAEQATLTDQQRHTLAAFADAGYTPVAVAVDGTCCTMLAFDDAVREETPALLAQLRASGRRLYLLSGDDPAVVSRLSDRLGLEAAHAHGHVGPEAKHRFIRTLQAEGRTVAMIGDGMNDALALQTADVGIAVQGHLSASGQAADVWLTRAGLQPVRMVFEGAAGVMRVIRSTLTFSLAYNVLGAGAAMMGWVNPLVAAVAMPLSSLVVVIVSITQRTFRTTSARTADKARTQKAVAQWSATPT